MPFDASGVFQRLYNWRNDRDAGIKILAERMDQEMDGVVQGLNEVVQGDVGLRGPVKGVSGTAALPAFSFSDDPDTGFYRESADVLAITVGGQKIASLTTVGLTLVSGKTISNADLVGVPTAPTAALGTDSQQLSTTAFVAAAIDQLSQTILNAPPATLDTLNELAAALGDDPNFATTMTAALAGKFDKTGGAISGNVDVSGRISQAGHDVMPVGTIITWYGDIVNRPSGFAPCDGGIHNGVQTPDARDKFLVGSSLVGMAGGVGGSNTFTTSSEGDHTHSATTSFGGSHSHGGSTASHALTVNEIPSHTHPYVGGTVNGGVGLGGSGATNGTQNTSAAGGGAGHSHTVWADGVHNHTLNTSDAGAHTHSGDNRPAFMEFHVLMRVY